MPFNAQPPHCAPIPERNHKGKAAAYKIKHANVLLKVDADGPAWTDAQAAEAFSCSPRTVCSIRQCLVEQGLEAALDRKKRKRAYATADRPDSERRKEARLIQIACSDGTCQ